LDARNLYIVHIKNKTSSKKKQKKQI